MRVLLRFLPNGAGAVIPRPSFTSSSQTVPARPPRISSLGAVPERRTVLRIHVLDDRRAVDLDRAAVVLDRLADLRTVEGDLPQWRATYELEDPSEAMATCALDLTGLDPDWVQYLDFEVLRSAPARNLGGTC